jgi:hypothetical protein
VVDEFLRLACLTYGDGVSDRLRRAQALLEQHEWLERASIHTIAACGSVNAARELLASDPTQASLVGGPHRWEPLLCLTYSRVPLGPGRSAVAVARLLLEHGADPNAGYLWEGLVPPFTALTGALGGGGRTPLHPEQIALARVLLEAGADADHGQTLYNRGWGSRPAGGLHRHVCRPCPDRRPSDPMALPAQSLPELPPRRTAKREDFGGAHQGSSIPAAELVLEIGDGQPALERGIGQEHPVVQFSLSHGSGKPAGHLTVPVSTRNPASGFHRHRTDAGR